MRARWFAAGLVVVGAGIGLSVVQGDQDNPPKPGAGAARPRSPDEKAIGAVVEAFTKAFNAGDSKAIAALHTPDAHMIDLAGEVIEGQRAIEEEYAGLFKDNPGLKIEVRPEALRTIGPDAAIEDGLNRVIPRSGPPVVNRYTVVYVRHGGRWLHASVRESAGAEPTHQERLKELEWMLGDWIDEGSDSVILTTCRWSEDKNSLVRDFTIKSRGQVAMTGTQRIGWDPLSRQVKSWVFDSSGGHGEGLWARLGHQWVVKATGVLPDGRTSTATHIIAQEGKEACRWRTVDRTVGGEVIPDVEEFVMVRRPPQPRPK